MINIGIFLLKSRMSNNELIKNISIKHLDTVYQCCHCEDIEWGYGATPNCVCDIQANYTGKYCTCTGKPRYIEKNFGCHSCTKD
jgi:hypothetical protein